MVAGASVATAAVSTEPGSSMPQRRRWDTVRQVLMGLAPIAALVLFFLTRSWLWFLAIPAVGILLYGPFRRD